MFFKKNKTKPMKNLHEGVFDKNYEYGVEPDYIRELKNKQNAINEAEKESITPVAKKESDGAKTVRCSSCGSEIKSHMERCVYCGANIK